MTENDEQHGNKHRFCKWCGNVVNPDIPHRFDCETCHEEYASWGWNFCPYCRKDLHNNLRGG